jgi:transcriptional regulator with XRE-family HTH domain
VRNSPCITPSRPSQPLDRCDCNAAPDGGFRDHGEAKRGSHSQAVLGERIGVTQGAISSWETGRVSVPRDQADALRRALSSGDSAASSPGEDYGEWLRGRREATGKTRVDIVAAADVNTTQIRIHNIEPRRTLNPRERTRRAVETAFNEQAPRELLQAVEESPEIRSVGRLTDFDPYSEDDLPGSARCTCCTRSALVPSM